jgi:hypothetical protein
VSFALFTNGFSSFSLGNEYGQFCALFNPFELNAIIGDSLLDNYYRCTISFYLNPLVDVIEDGTEMVSIDIGDYEDNQESTIIPDSFHIGKNIQTNDGDISSNDTLSAFDMRLYNWRSFKQYATIPDIYTIYNIIKTRKCAFMDITYPKKCIIKIIYNLYHSINNVDNIILVYFYFHLSCRVMNIPCKNTIFLDFTNILLKDRSNYVLGTYIEDDTISSYNDIITIMTEQIHELYNKIMLNINKLD